MSEASGARITQKMAEVIAATLTKHKAMSVPHDAAMKQKVVTATLEQWERELAPHVAETMRQLLDNEGLPDHLRPLIESLVSPQNQTGFFELVLSIIFLLQPILMRLAAPWLQAIESTAWRADPTLPLSIGEAASAVVKGWLTLEQGAAEARDQGLNAEKFGTLVNTTGNPPGPQTLLEMWRRGITTETGVEVGLREGFLRNDWIAAMKAMVYGPPPAGEAVAAAVQGHLTIDEARALVAEDGIDPKHFEQMYETAGNPPGTMEMIELWRRGDVSEADVRQAIRESRVKNKYVDAILKLRHRIPPLRSVTGMIARGIMSEADGRTLLEKLGYFPEHAAALAKEAASRKLDKHRDIAEGEVKTLYRDQVIDRPRAIALLRELDYDDLQAHMIVDLVDAEHKRVLRDAAVTKVRNAYIGHKADRTTTSARLDALEVSRPERDLMIGLWDDEREAQVRLPTVAELTRGFKLGLLTEAQYHDRLVAYGYSDADARLLMATHAGVGVAEAP